MATPLTPDQKAEYTRIIDGILSTTDLNTVTRKKVRQGLEKALGGRDLSEQKSAIKALIEDRFDAISAEAQVSGAISGPPSPAEPPSPKVKRSFPAYANGHAPKQENVEDDEGQEEEEENKAGGNREIKVSLPRPPPPPSKKRKSTEDEDEDEDADAKLAAQLQAEENQLARGRTTRLGGTAKPKKKKKKDSKEGKHSNKKSKSDKIVKDDDSAVASSEEESWSQQNKRNSGFQKPFNLSYPLAELCQEPQLSRPQVVKRLWQHIKAHDLQDPSDKRQIRCDEKMQAIFKQARVDMFQMNKMLGNHLYPIDEE